MDTVRILGFKEIFRETEFANAHSNGDLGKCAEAIFAMCFFLGAEQNRYGSLFCTLDTDTLLGNDQYLSDIETAFDILCRCNNNAKKNNRNRLDPNQFRDRNTISTTERAEPHYMFLQVGQQPCPGADGTITERSDGKYPRCYNCNKLGHLANNCPDPPGKGGTQSVMNGL